jgi:hypothetical protein
MSSVRAEPAPHAEGRDAASALTPPPRSSPLTAPRPGGIPASAPEARGSPVRDAGDGEAVPGPCALGALCVGPLASLGLPTPFGVGFHARLGAHFGLGLDRHLSPVLDFEDISVRWSAWTFEGRWYPFGSAFWLGVAYVHQALSAEASATTRFGPVTARGSVGVPALRLGLGFMGKSGLVFGIDVGLNIPLAEAELRFDVSAPSGDEPAITQRMRDRIASVTELPILLITRAPQLNLLRIGYLF